MLEPLIVSFHVIRGSPSPLFVLPFLPEIIRNCLNIGAEVHSFNSIFFFFIVLHLSAFLLLLFLLPLKSYNWLKG